MAQVKVPAFDAHAVLDDIINVFIDHNLTIKAVKSLFHDHDTFSLMMNRLFCSPPSHTIKKNELYHGLILFLKDHYPGCIQMIYEREKNPDYDSPDLIVPYTIYDEYISWAQEKNLRAYNRYRFYEVLPAMGLQRRTKTDPALADITQGPSGSG